MLKKILLLLLLGLVIIQFIHPSKNNLHTDGTTHISTSFNVSLEIQGILEKACNDCHSNNTRYPWYSRLQPVDWWLNSHVQDGKKEINFDEFTNKSLRFQYHKMDEIREQVEKDEMPLNSYTWIHKDAILTPAEKSAIINWTNDLQSKMKSIYPMDSLVRKK